MLAGLAYGISTIAKGSKNPRGLFLYRLAALMIFVGGGLGLLHGFQNIGWVHHYHYQVYYYGFLFKAVALGMLVVLLLLRVHKDVEPCKKTSQP